LQDFQCPKSSPHYPLAPSDPLRLRMVPPASHVEAPHASSSPFSAPPVKEARIDTSQSSKTDAIRLGEADSNGFADERKLKTALRKTRSCVLHNCNEANNLDSGLTRGNTLLHRTLRSRSLYSDCSHSTARNSKVWKAERVKSSREKMDLPEASKLSTFHPKVRSRTSSTNSRLYPQTDSTATMLTKSNHNLLVENRPPNDQKPGLMKNTEHPNLGVQMKKRQSSSKTEAIEILSATPKKPFGRPRKASLEIKVNDGNVAKKSTNCSSTKEKCNSTLVRAKRFKSASRPDEPSVEDQERASKDGCLEAAIIGKDDRLQPEPFFTFALRRYSSIPDLPSTTNTSHSSVPSPVFKSCPAKRLLRRPRNFNLETDKNKVPKRPCRRPQQFNIPIRLTTQSHLPKPATSRKIEINCPKKQLVHPKGSAFSTEAQASTMIPNPRFNKHNQQSVQKATTRISDPKPENDMVPMDLEESPHSSVLLHQQYHRLDNSSSPPYTSLKVDDCSSPTSEEAPHKGHKETYSHVKKRLLGRPRKSREFISKITPNSSMEKCHGTSQKVESSEKCSTLVSSLESEDCQLPVKTCVDVTYGLKQMSGSTPVSARNNGTLETGSEVSRLAVTSGSKKCRDRSSKISLKPGSDAPKKPRGRPRKSINEISTIEKCDEMEIVADCSKSSLGMPKSSKLSTPVSGVESDDCLLPVKTEWPSSRCLSSNPDHQNDQMKGSTPAESIPEQANDSRVSRPRSSTNSSAAQTAPFLKKSVKRPHEQRLKPSKDAPKKPRGRPPKSTSLGSHQTSDQPHSWIPSITTSTPEQINGDMKETASKKVLEHHSKLRSKTGSTIKIGDSRINVKIEDSPRPNSSPLASDSNPDHWVNSSTSALPYQTNDIVEGSFDIVSPDGNSTPMKTENRLADSNIPKKPSGPTCKSASVRSSIEKFEISPIKMERPESSLVEPFGPVSDVVREQPSSATEYRRTLRPVKVEPDYLEESSSSSDTPSLSSQSPVHNVNSVRSKRNLSTSDEGQAGRRPSVDSTSAGRKLLSSDCGTKRIPSHPPKREKLVFFGPKNRRGRPRKVRLPSDEIQHACTSFKSQSDAKKLLTDDSRENLAPQCQEMAVQTDDVSFSLGNFFIIPDI
ncbi:unnamed protein product, partial [Nesidiocoris tenuis]